MRATARTTPIVVPMIIATTVNPRVTFRPRRIVVSENHSATTGHSKLRLVATVTIVWAASTKTIAQATTLPQGKDRFAWTTSIASPSEASRLGEVLMGRSFRRG